MSNVQRLPGTGLSKSALKRARAKARDPVAAIANEEIRIAGMVSKVLANPSAKTLKNRARRAKQRARRAAGGVSGNQLSTPWHLYFQAAESATLEESVHKRLQTLFFPTLGLHRGLARSFTPTALAYTKGSLDITATTAGSGLSIVFNPLNAASGNFIIYNLVTTGFPNPYAASGPVGANGPYNSNFPGGQMRIVSASLQVIPEGAMLSQGGAGAMFYLPNGTDYAATNGTLWTRGNLDNTSVMNDFNGSTGIIMHWVPNSYEQDFPITTSATAPVVSQYSSLGLYLTGIPANTAFRVEWTVGVEYVPNSTYQSLVTRESASIHPDTAYWTSVVSNKHWFPLILSDLTTYQESLSVLSDYSYNGHSDIAFIGNAGQSGLGTSAFDRDVVSYPNAENPVAGAYNAFANRAFRGAARAAQNPYVQNYGSNLLSRYLPSIAGAGMAMMANRLANVNRPRIMPGAFN